MAAMMWTTAGKVKAAKALANQGRYQDAAKLVIDIAPEKVASNHELHALAGILMHDKQYETAREFYEVLYGRSKTHRVMVALIDLCLKLKEPKAAEQYLREFRKMEPDNPERLVFRYRVDCMLGKSNEYLLKSLTKLKDEDYTDIWALELAKIYFKENDMVACQRECRDILLWFPDSALVSRAQLLLRACESVLSADAQTQPEVPDEAVAAPEALQPDVITEAEEDAATDAQQVEIVEIISTPLADIEDDDDEQVIRDYFPEEVLEKTPAAEVAELVEDTPAVEVAELVEEVAAAEVAELVEEVAVAELTESVEETSAAGESAPEIELFAEDAVIEEPEVELFAEEIVIEEPEVELFAEEIVIEEPEAEQFAEDILAGESAPEELSAISVETEAPASSQGSVDLSFLNRVFEELEAEPEEDFALDMSFLEGYSAEEAPAAEEMEEAEETVEVAETEEAEETVEIEEAEAVEAEIVEAEEDDDFELPEIEFPVFDEPMAESEVPAAESEAPVAECEALTAESEAPAVENDLEPEAVETAAKVETEAPAEAQEASGAREIDEATIFGWYEELTKKLQQDAEMDALKREEDDEEESEEEDAEYRNAFRRATDSTEALEFGFETEEVDWSDEEQPQVSFPSLENMVLELPPEETEEEDEETSEEERAGAKVRAFFGFGKQEPEDVKAEAAEPVKEENAENAKAEATEPAEEAKAEATEPAKPMSDTEKTNAAIEAMFRNDDAAMEQALFELIRNE